MAYDNRDSCLLSKAKNKSNAKAPDYYGQVEFTEETIRYLAFQLKEGVKPELRVALWRKENDRGVYLSMSLSVPRDNAEKGSPRRAEPSRYENDDRRATTRPRDAEETTRGTRPSRDDDFDDEIPF